MLFSLGNDRGYFVAIFTQREMLKVQGHEIIPYPNTKMDRNLLVVHVSQLLNFFKFSEIMIKL